MSADAYDKTRDWTPPRRSLTSSSTFGGADAESYSTRRSSRVAEVPKPYYADRRRLEQTSTNADFQIRNLLPIGRYDRAKSKEDTAGEFMSAMGKGAAYAGLGTGAWMGGKYAYEKMYPKEDDGTAGKGRNSI
jgi:hypothetical protein